MYKQLFAAAFAAVCNKEVTDVIFGETGVTLIKGQDAIGFVSYLELNKSLSSGKRGGWLSKYEWNVLAQHRGIAPICIPNSLEVEETELWGNRYYCVKVKHDKVTDEYCVI